MAFACIKCGAWGDWTTAGICPSCYGGFTFVPVVLPSLDETIKLLCYECGSVLTFWSESPARPVCSDRRCMELQRLRKELDWAKECLQRSDERARNRNYR